MKADPDDTDEGSQQPSNTGPGGRELANFWDNQGLLDIDDGDPDTTKGVLTAMEDLMKIAPDSLNPIKVSESFSERQA